MTTLDRWTRWPAGDAPLQERFSRARQVLAVVLRTALLVAVVANTFSGDRYTGWQLAAAIGWIVSSAVLFAIWHRASRAHRLAPALGSAAVLLTIAALAAEGGATLLAGVIWCGLAVMAVVRLPLGAALITAAGSLASYAFTTGDSLIAVAAVTGGIGLLGYLLRLDTEARSAQRALLAQERAAHAAEAESAALTERARIAREIHDVLAHSLSAQLVHLEAARLMLDRGADREQIRERVVAARRMAQDGLAETRQALSALRGELTPVADQLADLARQEQAELTVRGAPRPLPAEAGLALRRTAQEALTNVRKHAPGSRTTVRLAYLDDGVELEVRNGRPPRGGDRALADSGSGYGLLGMRERAELLGGDLLAGPDDGGWRVLLRLPGDRELPA
ncbi:sensor histidine kinase [Kitasatospora cinereorecta]|uniref:histidine kinase n=1 Tax=Kitasatospora cinereorecta TaxID=285560 RepID=A0ABW0V8P1_9ACTN